MGDASPTQDNAGRPTAVVEGLSGPELQSPPPGDSPCRNHRQLAEVA